MSGGNMHNGDNIKSLDVREFINTIERVLDRTLEDLIEAYFRTPYYISSKKYIYRSLRRVQNALSYTRVYKLKIQ